MNLFLAIASISIVGVFGAAGFLRLADLVIEDTADWWGARYGLVTFFGVVVACLFAGSLAYIIVMAKQAV